MCEFHAPFSGSKNSTKIGCFDSVAIVSGVMNCLASGVITTRTSAPAVTNVRHKCAALYAAMLPVMPNKIRRPCKSTDRSFCPILPG